MIGKTGFSQKDAGQKLSFGAAFHISKRVSDRLNSGNNNRFREQFSKDLHEHNQRDTSGISAEIIEVLPAEADNFSGSFTGTRITAEINGNNITESGRAANQFSEKPEYRVPESPASILNKLDIEIMKIESSPARLRERIEKKQAELTTARASVQTLESELAELEQALFEKTGSSAA